ncbi:MAG: hypothetical protein KDD94_03090 [Calditrichaeota bacterium]|nr:hypothetical protein [Calditrichota bacterium]
MLKAERNFHGIKIQQYQLGYISIELETYFNDETFTGQRTLLASNVYVLHIDQTIWILDSAYSDSIQIDYIKPKLSHRFAELVDQFSAYKNVNLLISHAHPDHIGGLIENFAAIKRMNWRIFFNLSDWKKTEYLLYPPVQDFIENELKSYANLFPIDRSEYFKTLYKGGHTSDHAVIAMKKHPLIYPADLIPTVYHLSHLPKGEKNSDQTSFESIRERLLSDIEKMKPLLLLPHAPNSGFFEVK